MSLHEFKKKKHIFKNLFALLNKNDNMIGENAQSLYL